MGRDGESLCSDGEIGKNCRDCSEAAAQFRSMHQRTHVPTIDQRADRAWESCLQFAMALDGDPIAFGNDAILQDPRKRPPVPREPLPRNVQCARRGAAGGPSGMIAEALTDMDANATLLSGVRPRLSRRHDEGSHGS